MIYSKTQLGHSALHNRSIPITPRQRSAFILFDGKRDIQDVLKATAGLGITLDDVTHLVSLGLLAPLAAAAPVRAPAALATTAAASTLAPSASASASAPAALPASPSALPSVSAQAHYSKAYPIATRLTAGLGLRGFRLNLAVEAAGDLNKLKELAPRIKEAVGAEKFLELYDALYE